MRKFCGSLAWPRSGLNSRVIKATLLRVTSVDSCEARKATAALSKHGKIMFEQPAKYLTENVRTGKHCC